MAENNPRHKIKNLPYLCYEDNCVTRTSGRIGYSRLPIIKEEGSFEKQRVST